MSTSSFARGLTDLLTGLVKLPTLGPGVATDAALHLLADYVDVSGVDVVLSRSAAGVPTLVATLRGREAGPHVLLLGHVDVVPIDEGWQRDPFAAETTDGVMYGRGTVDMKSGLAAFAASLVTLAGSGTLERGAVTLLVDVDEETGSEAGLIPYVAQHGLDEYDWAICGEPTGLRPYLGNRGLIWASIRVSGRAAHAGMPDEGANPIPVLARLITSLPSPVFASGPYGARGPSLSPTVLRGGRVHNSIPDVAEVLLDRRLVPGEDVDGAIEGLRAAAFAASASSGLPVACDIEKVWPPCLLDETSDLARIAQRITREAGRDGRFGFDDASDDASFTHAAGVPTLLWGPGAPELAHTSDEWIALDEVHLAHDLYVRAILELTQTKEADDVPQ